jgi:hypothetical protein
MDLTNLNPADLNIEKVKNQVLTDLAYELLLQQVRAWNYYPLRSAKIAAGTNVKGQILINGDADFKAERIYIAIDNAFTAGGATIFMKITDAAGQLITREPIDIRTIASPGIFDPSTPNEAVAHFADGSPFFYTFRKNTVLQFEFTSTEAAQGPDHYVSVTLAGVSVKLWDRIPHQLG